MPKHNYPNHRLGIGRDLTEKVNTIEHKGVGFMLDDEGKTLSICLFDFKSKDPKDTTIKTIHEFKYSKLEEFSVFINDAISQFNQWNEVLNG